MPRNPDLAHLQPYPFAKLAALFNGITPPAAPTPLLLSLGEPSHATPAIVREALIAHLNHLSTYPNTRGLLALREAIAAWLMHRFQLPATSVDPDRHILPVNGTREALFAVAQAFIDRTAAGTRPPRVVMPNPFYQIYEGAALLAGAQPYYLSGDPANGFLPDFNTVPEQVWQDCQLLYVCSPANPTGAVLTVTQWHEVLALAERYDFIIVADECYSELYPNDANPPPGLLQAAAAAGLNDWRRCLVLHSLSKRSNAPGLRSGFIAGDAELIAQLFTYRTYHGCVMPLQHQYASIAAWQDEQHVIINRQLYREKFAAVLAQLAGVLPCAQPAGGFYIWAATPGADTDFSRALFANQNVTVLPGQFLSRCDAHGHDPGRGYIRIALVAPLADCCAAARRICAYCATLTAN